MSPVAGASGVQKMCMLLSFIALPMPGLLGETSGGKWLVILRLSLDTGSELGSSQFYEFVHTPVDGLTKGTVGGPKHE